MFKQLFAAHAFHLKQPLPLAETSTPAVQLLDVNIFSYQIRPTDQYLQEPVQIYQLEVGHDMQLAFNMEEELMGVRLYLNVEGKDEHQQPLGINGYFGIEHELAIDNLKKLVDEKTDGQYSLDPELGHAVMNIIYGTARGIVLEKTRGTILGPTILPVVDPDDLLGQSG